MQEVKLAPFQGPRRCVGSIEGVWLHPLDMTNMLDMVGRGVATFTGEHSWGEGESQRRHNDAETVLDSHGIFLSWR